MKKIFILYLIATTLLFATACNKQIIDLNYEFDHAYCKIGDEYFDLEIKSWTDYEDGEQLQIKLKDGTVLLVASYNCILYKGKLPKKGE